MISKCIDKKRCESINYEGQWLLGTSLKEASHLLNPGSMCKYNSNNNDINTIIKQHFIKEWSKYWDFNSYILVEKSPQSMLKIPLMNTIFNNNRNKFIISIKHPITLNVALPRDMEWLYHYNNKKQSSKTDINTIDMIVTNFKYFIHFMTHNNNETTGRGCSIGWLEAMETLHDMLNNNDNNNNHNDYINSSNVRIIRYEEYRKPYGLCINIMKFVYFDNDNDKNSIRLNLYTDAVNDVCQKYLSDQNILTKNTKIGNRMLLQSSNDSNDNSNDDGNDNGNDDIRRSLRLNDIQDNSILSFNPEIMYNSIIKRTKGFEIARKMMKDNKDNIIDYNDIERSLQLINDRLQKFGYGLNFKTLYSYKNNNTFNLFDAYELKNYT